MTSEQILRMTRQLSKKERVNIAMLILAEELDYKLEIQAAKNIATSSVLGGAGALIENKKTDITSELGSGLEVATLHSLNDVAGLDNFLQELLDKPQEA